MVDCIACGAATPNPHGAASSQHHGRRSNALVLSESTVGLSNWGGSAKANSIDFFTHNNQLQRWLIASPVARLRRAAAKLLPPPPPSCPPLQNYHCRCCAAAAAAAAVLPPGCSCRGRAADKLPATAELPPLPPHFRCNRRGRAATKLLPPGAHHRHQAAHHRRAAASAATQPLPLPLPPPRRAATVLPKALPPPMKSRFRQAATSTIKLAAAATLPRRRRLCPRIGVLYHTNPEAGALQHWILIGGIRSSYGRLDALSLKDCHTHKKSVRKVPGAQLGLNS
jgi:hypothetical protein